MKKLILTLILSLFWMIQTNAQLFKVFGHDVGFVYVGPKVGMNLSKFSQWSYSNYTVKNRLGYQLGVVGELGFTNRFSVQGEFVLNLREQKENRQELRKLKECLLFKFLSWLDIRLAF
ncbi:MAG: hypothetical protein PWR03_763 [Tenuifilum sp.]|uniref:outer membrane beta-barrel protein n=1 Tax=Tenuifilum sp. TaxID=2760880 RepID=UPI0024AA35F6|nr:outer membrane beta-barrel protein [Tenuifilum sp.]MDI3526580.1 hypothetical protein [Tenuifilum sp.]